MSLSVSQSVTAFTGKQLQKHRKMEVQPSMNNEANREKGNSLMVPLLGL